MGSKTVRATLKEREKQLRRIKEEEKKGGGDWGKGKGGKREEGKMRKNQNIQALSLRLILTLWLNPSQILQVNVTCYFGGYFRLKFRVKGYQGNMHPITKLNP